MHVIGIDPAPAKGGTIFDGTFRHLLPYELGQYLDGLSRRKDVLVCWDAPLTGPQDPSQPGKHFRDFTQRPIETFFSRQEYGFKTPPGISVRGYAGCPHWTISRAYLGLPRIGVWDRPAADLPYKPLLETKFQGSVETGPFIAEVHPAVAIWRWCVDQRPHDADWNYKKSKDTQEAIIDIVVSRCTGNVPRPTNDDELDALAAWMLGVSWVTGNNDVTLLGNANAGSFLLPHTDELAHAFEAFLAEESI
jgi:hypothetical protein